VELHGFSRVSAGGTARGLFFDFDDLFLSAELAPADPTQIELNAAHRDFIDDHARDGWLLFVHAWRPGIAKREFTMAHVDATFSRARDLLGDGIDITFACCPHDAGPPVCWCRKPLPGSLLEFARHKDVDLTRSLIVPGSAADRTMAARLGVPLVNEEC
jgi:D-glycero-D-manno-heptose 1,7-bisphosphate phosphatase